MALSDELCFVWWQRSDQEHLLPSLISLKMGLSCPWAEKVGTAQAGCQFFGWFRAKLPHRNAPYIFSSIDSLKE